VNQVRRIMDALTASLVRVELDGEQLVLDPLFPEEHPMDAALVEQVREHKDILVARLRWEEQADRLLLEASHRLAAVYPGCPLECDVWQPHEDALQAAYHDGDLGALARALAARERFAKSVFDAHRKAQP